MAVPSVTGGITVLENCGSAPISPLASSTVVVATSLGTQFNQGINGTANGNFGNGSDNKGGALMGGIYALAGSTDLSTANRLGFFHFTTHDRVSTLTSTTGLMLTANSSSLGTEEAVWSVNGDVSSSYQCAVVNFNRSTDAKTYTGTFDSADITHLGIAATFDSTFASCKVDTFGYVDPYKVINGVTGDKGDFTYVTSNININNSIIDEFPTVNLHHIFFSWGVGDGSTATDFLEILKVWEFAKQVDFTGNWGRAHINDNDTGYETNASASDVVSFELCNWISDSPFYWNSIGSTSATVSYTSCVIQNAGDVTVVDGHIFSGCTFDSCATIQASIPTLTNVAIKNSAVQALELADGGGANLTSVTFTGNQTAIIVDTAGNAAINVQQCTFDTSNTFYIEYTGTGTLTVTASGTIASGKLNASGGGTITVVAPTTTFTINSSETGSFIQIFTTATQTVLDSATSNTLAYDFSGTVVVDYVVQKAGFLPQRFVGVTLTDSSTAIAMVTSREYDSGHGLVYSTDASWASNQLTVPTFGVTGQGVFSLMLDSFIAQSALYNTAFNLEMDGTGSLYLTNGAEGNADSSIENLTNCGCAYLTSAQVTTALWSGVLSVGTATGFQGEYQQIDGTTTTDARATGIFNELIKTFGDASHGNFDYTGHLVLKYQPNTYRESRADIIDSYSLTALAPTLYIVALEPISIGITAGDPAISITIVDRTSSPLVVGGKSFDFEVQDNGTNDGNAILREINYNLSLDATYQGRDPFNWPELVLLSGTSYESIYGIVEGLAGLHGVYVSRSSADHPDFTRHQSNDGTYYVKPITANAQTSGIFANSYLQIINKSAKESNAWGATTATSVNDRILRSTGVGAELTTGLYMRCTTAGTTAGSEPTWNTTVGSTTTDGTVTWTTMGIAVEDGVQASDWSLSYIEGEEFQDGDEVRYRVTFENGALYKFPIQAITIAGSTGFTILLSQVDWANVNTWAIDGSSETSWVKDGTNIDIDISGSGSGTKKALVAWWAYLIASDSEGIELFWDAYDVESSASIKQDVSVVDVVIEKTSTGNFQFTDNDVRYYRSDFSSPYDTTGNSIFMDYSGVPLIVETGVSGLTATEANQLALIDSVDGKVDIVNTKIGTPVADVSADIAAVKAVTDAIPTTAMRGTDSANTVAPDNASITAIKAKTDSLTFTKANEVDSNVQSVNDVDVIGTGISSDLWRA